MGGKNNRAKAHLKGRPVIRLPGQVVLATPVTVVGAPAAYNAIVSLYAHLCAACAWSFAIVAPIFFDVCSLFASLIRPIYYPICFCVISAIILAGVYDLAHSAGSWLVKLPAAIASSLTGAIADPELNGTARGATAIATLACFTFGHFCSKSAWAYQEPLLNVTIPARPMWELVLGTRSDIELGKQFTDSAASVKTVLEDLSLICHSDHLADVAA
jgi:hypothetical protein